MNETILIVEDEPDLLRLLDVQLRARGYLTLRATTGREALRLAEAHTPDLVLLDRMLPDMDGAEICTSLRQKDKFTGMSIIMLTARDQPADRIRGLEAGADDYVPKPFSLRELMLRIQAVLRRRWRGDEPAINAPAPSNEPLRAGELELDMSAHHARVNGTLCHLTRLEFALLAALLTEKGRVQSRERLLRTVWDLHTGVATRTVDTHVRRLRRKLGAAGWRIETVRGVGYRLSDAETPP